MAKTMIRAYGLRALLARHPQVRRLKRSAAPSIHGNKTWPSSWVLVDYLARKRLPLARPRVMELGAGWGLAGIYCARRLGAHVTAVDKDAQVFAFLRLQAAANGVRIRELNASFASLKPEHLSGIDVLIGSDICFWDTLVTPLRRLVRRALACGVRLVLIADPGRSPFERLADFFVARGIGQIIDWTTRRPRSRWGRILRIENHARPLASRRASAGQP